MKGAILVVLSIVTLVRSAPLYGNDGGYMGFASYKPSKGLIQRALSRTGSNTDDTIDSSAGSPEISKTPSSSEEDSSEYVPKSPVRHRPYIPADVSSEYEHDVSKGSVRHRPSKPADVSSEYSPRPLPKKYDVLDYTTNHKHGYGGNRIVEKAPDTPYHRATLYGQSDGGYKIADAYQNQNIDSLSDNEHNYKDDYISYPQPYEYGYALKDKHGNTQHKYETSDGHGSVKGSYGFTDEHGLYRSVEYVADKGGFRAAVKTNEPGTENKDPADVSMEVEGGHKK